MEKQYDFSLTKSLELAAKSPFLKGYEVHVTRNVKPPPEEMRSEFKCHSVSVGLVIIYRGLIGRSYYIKIMWIQLK